MKPTIIMCIIAVVLLSREQSGKSRCGPQSNPAR
jgi:hypothetical protein